MSNVSNQHTVIPFVAGQSKPLNGQRLIRVLYKDSKKAKAQYPSVCVSVPPLEKSILQDSRFTDYLLESLQTLQDGIVKGLYESRKGKLERVSDDDISANAMASYLVAQKLS